MLCLRLVYRCWQPAAVLALLGGVAGSSLPSTCKECTSQGYSWQVGECHAEECPVMDVACYTTLADCDDYDEDLARRARCSASSVDTCAKCLVADPECLWNKESGSCFSGSGYWGPPTAVVKAGGTCPDAVPMPIPLEGADRLKQRLGSRGGAPGNSTSLDMSLARKVSNQTATPKAELPSTCGECVVQGKSWQANECHAEECPVQDVGCYTTLADCQDYEEAKRAQEKCEGLESCGECHTADPQCLWQLSSRTCLAGPTYTGLPDDVVSSIGVCPQEEEKSNERLLQHVV